MSSSLRVGGLASGIDTESIIKELLKTEQNKIDKLVKQRTLLEWKRDDFRAVNTKLLALRTATADLKDSDTFNAKSATSANESILTATAETTATPGNYNITVKQLAQKASMTSQQALGSNENVSSVAAQFGIDEDTQIDFTIAGANGEVPFSFTAGETSLSDIVKIINEEDMGISAYYDASVDRVFLMSTESGLSGITVKMDGMRDSTGEVILDSEGNCMSFLEDYLKLKVDNGSLNEVSPANGHKINSNSPIIIHDDANITISEMYADGTAPANVSFTL
ncbi:MAG: flagellar cap protein FliD N-terminal domain-containing protein, partial [Syntrophomonas sp.]